MRCTEQHADIIYNIHVTAIQHWYINGQHTYNIKLPSRLYKPYLLDVESIYTYYNTNKGSGI